MSEHNPHVKSPVLGDFDPKKVNNYIQIFLGTDRPDYQRYETLITHWVSYNQAAADKNVDASQVAALKATYDEYVSESFANAPKEEIDRLANSFFNFMMELTETEFYRNDVFRKDHWENTSPNEKEPEKPLTDIRYLIPSASGKHSMRDAIRRSSRRSAGDAENIGIILRNSLIHIRIARPTTLELARLVENVNREIVNYVRQVNGSSLSLARMSIIRVIWRFVADRITWCSVKDTQDYYELANHILWNDVGALAVGLISASGQRGVDLGLQHMKEGCNWSSFKRVDPSLLLHHMNENLDEKQREALRQLETMARTFSREEIAKFQSMTNYGLPMDVQSPDKNGFVTLGVPTLMDAFVQFDCFVDRITPAIQEARANNIDQGKYEEQVSTIIASVQGAEYAHWIKSLTLNADPDTDEDPTTYTRAEDPVEFSEGLFDFLTDNDDLSRELIRKVRREAPIMSFSAVGVPNYVCEKCKESTADTNGAVRGITPIDPIMAFFTHTQLMISRKVTAGIEEQLEVL